MEQNDFQNDVLQRLTIIETKLSNGIITKQYDLEKRIRFLERGLYVAFGVIAALQIAVRSSDNQTSLRTLYQKER